MSPKAYEGREKKEKKSRLEDGRRNIAKELSWDPQRLPKGSGSLRHIAQLRQNQDSSKENTKKHKKQRADTSLSSIRDPARKRRKPKVTSHSAKERYLWELERGAIKKEVAAKIFRTNRVGFCPLGKNNKNEGRPKVEP